MKKIFSGSLAPPGTLLSHRQEGRFPGLSLPISGVELDTQMSEFLLSRRFDVFLKRDEVKPLIRSSVSSGPLLLLVIACRRCREQS